MNIELNGKIVYLWQRYNSHTNFYLETSEDITYEEGEVITGYKRFRKKTTDREVSFVVSGTGNRFEEEGKEGSYKHRIYLTKIKGQTK